MTGIEDIVRFEDDKRSKNPLDSTVYTRFNIKSYLRLSLTFDYEYYPAQPIGDGDLNVFRV